MVMEAKYKALSAAASFIGVWLIGGIVYHSLEKWSWLNSFYFAATTITTVGYGDLTPTSQLSKTFTIGYLFIGIAIALYALTVIGQYYVEKNYEHQAFQQINKRSPHRAIINKLKGKKKDA